MDISTMYVADSIRRERLAHAAQARQWARHAVTSSRLAGSGWSQHVEPTAVPVRMRQSLAADVICNVHRGDVHSCPPACQFVSFSGSGYTAFCVRRAPGSGGGRSLPAHLHGV